MKARRLGAGLRLPDLRSLAVAAGIAVTTLLALGGSPSDAAGQSMIGIDVRPDSNSPASVGDVETCASHDRGDEFEVDVFVNNVNSLRAWELRVDYDSDVVKLLSADYNYFLVTAPPGGQVFPSLFEQESSGRHFLAATEFRAAPDSGSGILARLTMEAVDDGTSAIRIVKGPPYQGPRFSDWAVEPLGDSSGDGIWDDTVVDGEIRVGRSCSGAPVVTPIPSPRPTTSPRPGTTARPTPGPGVSPGTVDDDGDDSTGGDSDTDNNSVTSGGSVVVNPGEGTGADDDSGEPGSAGAEDDTGAGGQAGSGDDASDGDPDGSGEDGDNADGSSDDPGNEGDRLPRARTSSDGGNTATWVFIIGAVAAAMVAAGGGLYVLSKRERL